MPTDTTTTNYKLIKPAPSGSPTTWGNKLNVNLDTVDQKLFNADGLTSNALVLTKPADGLSAAEIFFVNGAATAGQTQRWLIFADTAAESDIPPNTGTVLHVRAYTNQGVPLGDICTFSRSSQTMQVTLDPKSARDVASKNYVDITTASLTSGIAPIGSIVMWAAAALPAGWLKCSGGTRNVDDYPVLGVLLGGAAGGTFTLPNINGRFPLGAGGGGPPGTIGLLTTGGEATVTLAATQMPSHTHDASHGHTASQLAHSHGIGISNQSYGYGGTLSNAVQPGGSIYTDTQTPGVTINPATVTTSSVGGDQSHDNMPPYLGLNFIIRAL